MVGRYVRRYRVTGSVSPDKFGGYKDYALTNMPGGSGDGLPDNLT